MAHGGLGRVVGHHHGGLEVTRIVVEGGLELTRLLLRGRWTEVERGGTVVQNEVVVACVRISVEILFCCYEYFTKF